MTGKLFIARSLTSETKETRPLYAIAIIVAAFLGSMLEWTGYIFNAGLIVLFWLQSRDSTSSRALAIQILISTLFAGVLTIAHFSFALGFEDAINGFLGRFLVRNTSAGNLFELIRGYGLSYGWYIVVIIFLLAY